MSTMTGFCSRADHGSCSGLNLTGTGWNWWCVCRCHPEPVVTDETHRPALEYWRRHREEGS